MDFFSFLEGSEQELERQKRNKQAGREIARGVYRFNKLTENELSKCSSIAEVEQTLRIANRELDESVHLEMPTVTDGKNKLKNALRREWNSSRKQSSVLKTAQYEIKKFDDKGTEQARKVIGGGRIAPGGYVELEPGIFAMLKVDRVGGKMYTHVCVGDPEGEWQAIPGDRGNDQYRDRDKTWRVFSPFLKGAGSVTVNVEKEGWGDDLTAKLDKMKKSKYFKLLKESVDDGSYPEKLKSAVEELLPQVESGYEKRFEKYVEDASKLKLSQDTDTATEDSVNAEDGAEWEDDESQYGEELSTLQLGNGWTAEIAAVDPEVSGEDDEPGYTVMFQKDGGAEVVYPDFPDDWPGESIWQSLDEAKKAISKFVKENDSSTWEDAENETIDLSSTGAWDNNKWKGSDSSSDKSFGWTKGEVREDPISGSTLVYDGSGWILYEPNGQERRYFEDLDQAPEFASYYDERYDEIGIQVDTGDNMGPVLYGEYSLDEINEMLEEAGKSPKTKKDLSKDESSEDGDGNEDDSEPEAGGRVKGKDKSGNEYEGEIVQMIFGKPKIKTDDGEEVMLTDYEKA